MLLAENFFYTQIMTLTSVSTTVLYCDGRLLCGFNVNTKELSLILKTLGVIDGRAAMQVTEWILNICINQANWP